jgi:hypothetical protein
MQIDDSPVISELSIQEHGSDSPQSSPLLSLERGCLFRNLQKHYHCSRGTTCLVLLRHRISAHGHGFTADKTGGCRRRLAATVSGEHRPLLLTPALGTYVPMDADRYVLSLKSPRQETRRFHTQAAAAIRQHLRRNSTERRLPISNTGYRLRIKIQKFFHSAPRPRV